MVKRKRVLKIRYKRIALLLGSFLLFAFGITAYFNTYGEFVSSFESTTSGVSDNTVHVNDLTSDYNYFKGLNFAEVRNQYIPSGTSTGYYDDEYLVKVRIIYDGKDINNSSLVGAVSPINNENANKYIYYKYFALERNSNGTLATNSDGDNYIRVELIDNPFSKRPYVSSREYGFNGWVCNQSEDTTAGVCDNTTMRFDKTTYTRYMEIACDGEDEFTIHLNANWYRADVVTSAGDISDFNSMSMQTTTYTTTETIIHRYNAYWKQNYTQMEYDRSYNYNAGYLPVGVWYRTNRYSGTYYYVSQPNSVRADRWGWGNTTLYAFTANTTAITQGSRYTGGSVTFVRDFNLSRSNTDTTINTYNTTYTNIIEEPNGTSTETEQIIHTHSYLSNGINVQGYFYKVSDPTAAMINTKEYYNNDGSLCTNANNCRTAYKLIQYNDSLNNTNGHTISIIEEANGEIVDQDKYYYLVTRDLNIFRYTSNTTLTISNIAVDKPFTVTGAAVNGTTAAGILNVSNNLTVANDLVIENIRIYGPQTEGTNDTTLGNNSRSTYSIYANSHNLKIGRNVYSSRGTNYLAAYTVMGGSNSGAATGTFKVIVESGFYYAYHSGSMSGYGSYTLNETTIFGNDYDRVSEEDGKLRFNIGLDGYASGSNTAGSSSLFASFSYIKSGKFGYNGDGSFNSDNTAGLYIGGRASKCVNSITGVKIEGGLINTVVGGYAYNGSSDTNSTYIGMSGGTVRSIYGGAGHSTTVGNRIINVTGGLVTYSVLGGSDSNSTNDNDDGVVQGSTLVYVGGTATIGDENSTGTLYGVAPGGVFGAGGGKSGYDEKGTVYNSHVIINGGTIGSVYGGGNYGSTGTYSRYRQSSSTVIDILDGNIGSVFGGSETANFSQDNYKNQSTIDINMSGGTVGNIYGGSNAQGIVYGSVDIDITGGTVTSNVYGGGQGAGTFVSNNTDVTIGTAGVSGKPTIGGNVYGGSALGTVNSKSENGTATGNTLVTINNGTITGSVFGGGQGDNSNTPNVKGNVTVTVNGGTITDVYGANDVKGTPNGTINVYINGGNVTNTYGGGNLAPINTSTVHLNGGTSTNVYGGGKSANATTTNVLLKGSTTTNVYGGSNQSGTVTTSNVTVTSGSATTIYGGNNLGGTTTTSNITTSGGSMGTVFGGGNEATTGTTNVTINGGTISTAVYGGGNEASTGTTRVYLNGSTIPNVYGGGNKAGVTISTTVNLNGSTVTNLFGGSNTSGTVTRSNITTTSGSATTIYGGNNLGGTTTTTYITTNGGSMGTVYGGGNEAETDTTNVTINSGTFSTAVYGGGNQASARLTTVNLNGSTIPNVYGGGNQAGVTSSTNVYLTGSTVTNLFGGSNTSGTVAESNVNVSSGNATIVYGGNNYGGATTTTNITTTGGTMNTIYGGGNEAPSGTTNVTINGGTISNAVYGGGNLASANYTYVYLNSSTIPSVYGGGNRAGVTTSTNVVQRGSTVTNLFGGSNQSGTVATSNINVTGGTTTNVYGGNNQGGTTVNTNVSANGGSITNIYGGGNEANSTNTTININALNGTTSNVYGGGNQASVNIATINIRNGVTINNVFGGSNQSGTVAESRVNVPLSSVTPTISNLYGGNNQGGSTTDANITIACGTFGNIYGGGNFATTGNTNTSIQSAVVNGYVYGGGNRASVTNNTILRVIGSGVGNHVFGGGNLGEIGGNTNVYVSNSTLGNSLFAGGNGATAIVHGNTLLNVDGTTSVTNHVFGGGNAAATGTELNNNSTSIVNIAGLTCGGNVYGGANTSVLYGSTTVNIGRYATNNNILTPGNIHIGGTVFGGGEANESGSAIYDFSFISVTNGITINIDGNGHQVFDIDGSIFGSGNASSTSGYSNVSIKNYGTESAYKKNVSIQRASLVTLDNSVVELFGATDRTNEYSDVLFSISRVDELKLVNNSVLYLNNGTNLVKAFTSALVNNNTETKASVTIDDNGNITRNVNNKIYIYEGRNINIATNENITAYGRVSGMTFFGMYAHDRNGNVETALYKTEYTDSSTVPSSELVYFDKGSYVLGAHHTNHDYEVDGFYSNFPDKSTTDRLNVKYIIPTPEDSNFYMWLIGEPVASYDITLTASKYSTLGTYELPFASFSDANTTFSVLGFNYNELNSEVNLVDKEDVPRIAASGTIADNTMSLVMKSSDSGWITIGKTTFVTEAGKDENCTVTRNYLSENSAAVPTFVFYLYHSKNLETSGNMGTAVISMVAITPIDDLNNEVTRININVTLTRALYTSDDYEGTITTGKVYEMFAPSLVNITSTSSFTTYYSLFTQKPQTIYKPGYHRVLSSTYNFPVNTKITMIDLLSGTTPEYYYYVVNSADYAAREIELATNNDVSYRLDKFVKMGSSNTNNHYDDVAKNAQYYNSNTQIAEEEFIFIVDFKEAGIQDDVLNKKLLIELRNADNEIMLSVLGIQQEQLVFNLYYGQDAVIEVDGTMSTNEVYIGEDVGLLVETNFEQQYADLNPIIDTNFYDYRSGIKISIYDSNNNLVNGPSIMGISYTLGNNTYYPRFDGTVRINVAERIANVSSHITIHTEGSNLASGNYTMLIESFGSPDGIYYGLESSDQVRIPFTVKNTLYGLKVIANEAQLIVKKETGFTEAGVNAITFNFQYSSGLLHPNLRVSLYRRGYTGIYEDNYYLVDFKDVFSNNLEETHLTSLYMLNDTPQSVMSHVLYLKPNLTSGTYKIVFGLYDNDTYIGDVYKYIIIK